MAHGIKRFDFTPILGWSASRYDIFNACKRQYFYRYYGKYDPQHSRQDIDRLKQLTSIPLETGSIVHDVIGTVLKRLRVSADDIDADRFRKFVSRETVRRCNRKTFFEAYYKKLERVSADDLLPKINICLGNFLESERYRWVVETAIATSREWIVEPPGYGESRLGALKVYCKVDFLFPAGDRIVIIDWKTGKQDEVKHRKQLAGYTVWAAYHLDLSAEAIFPIIAYLQPEYDEFELSFSDDDVREFRARIHRETEEMYAFCDNVAENIPLGIDSFPQTENRAICGYCNFREFCGR